MMLACPPACLPACLPAYLTPYLIAYLLKYLRYTVQIYRLTEYFKLMRAIYGKSKQAKQMGWRVS